MPTVFSRRLACASVAVLLGAGAAVIAPAAVSAAASGTSAVTSGSASWGYKQSFRTYVSEETGRVPGSAWPQERASITVSGGASFDGNVDSTRQPAVNAAPYKWSATGGSINRSTGKGTVRFGGAVTYAYPNHYIGQMRFSNPTVVLDGKGGGSLLVDLQARLHEGQAGETPKSIDKSQFTLAKLTGATARTSGSTTTLTNAAATLTAEGAAQTDGFYSAGEKLDAISFTVTTKAASTGSSTSSGSGSSDKKSSDKSKATSSPKASASASTSASASASSSASASPSASGSASASTSLTPTPSATDSVAADLAVAPASSNESGPNALLVIGLIAIAALVAGGLYLLYRNRATPGTTETGAVTAADTEEK